MSTDQLSGNQVVPPAPIQLPQDLPTLNRWMFETIHPYINSRILELNSGVGELSSIFVEQGISVHVSDTEKTNRDKLRERFNEITTIRGVHNIDLLHPDFKQFYSSKLEMFNTLLALNLAEYGFPDKMALENAKHLLQKGGHLMMIAPTNTALYNELTDLGDWKKYNRRSVKQFLGNDFEIVLFRYFNLRESREDSLYVWLYPHALAIARKKT